MASCFVGRRGFADPSGWLDDIEITDEEFEEIAEVGRKNPIRYNVPFLYTPKWDIDVFDTPEEEKASRKVW
jgi:L-glyceraldehyde reductase